MSKRLSPAARGHRRGVLEVLKEPPQVIVSMERNVSTLDEAVRSYSTLALFLIIAGSTVATAMGNSELAAFLTVIFGGLSVVGIGSSSSQIKIHGEDRKRRIKMLVGNDAEAAAHGQEDVSIHETLSDHLEQSYVENLSPRQIRWVHRQWKRSFAQAVRKKERQDHNKLLAQSGHNALDTVIDREKIRKIKYLTKEMKRVHQGKALTDAEQFDKQMKEIETAR